jgi:cysteinyl-tRNA synthetase
MMITEKKYKFSVTENEAILYYQTLCDYVHLKGMKCMAKNSVKGCDNFDGVLCESFNNEKDW